VGYPGGPLFAADDFELRWRERAALIGPNGAGKTTFLRVALGQLEPLAGKLTLGASIKVGYFAQAHESLDPAMTVLDQAIARSHESGQRKLDEGQARYYLAKYLFKGEDVYKPVAGLSGGERARLALALLALTGANFLVLDEPTNHLDTVAQEALQEALEGYDGTVLLVSPYRYTARNLAPGAAAGHPAHGPGGEKGPVEVSGGTGPGGGGGGGEHLGSVHRGRGNGGRNADGQKHRRRDDAVGHAQRAVHGLGQHADHQKQQEGFHRAPRTPGRRLSHTNVVSRPRLREGRLPTSSTCLRERSRGPESTGAAATGKPPARPATPEGLLP